MGIVVGFIILMIGLMVFIRWYYRKQLEIRIKELQEAYEPGRIFCKCALVRVDLYRIYCVSIDLRHENARLRPLICALPVCVSSNIIVFAWSRPNKWAESRVLMSQVD
uniref:Uncharacterized protein n=1 Tax=Caenorhabditis japonica TaxID=281687 RepID=A0A8R1EGH4_CAEJA